MPWHEKAMKDVVSCEKLRGGANNLRPGDFRMGQPGSGNAESLPAEYIGRESERRELKHLSTWRKRKQMRFP